jgi:hypothetical protein
MIDKEGLLSYCSSALSLMGGAYIGVNFGLHMLHIDDIKYQRLSVIICWQTSINVVKINAPIYRVRMETREY